MNPLPTVKPGWTTSEFWTHVFIQLASVAITLLALFNPSNTLSSTLQVVLPSLAIPVALVAQIVYTIYRGGMKKATLLSEVQFIEAHFVDLETAAKTVAEGYKAVRKGSAAAKAAATPQAVVIPGSVPATSPAP
jgi:hypothetical protein